MPGLPPWVSGIQEIDVIMSSLGSFARSAFVRGVINASLRGVGCRNRGPGLATAGTGRPCRVLRASVHGRGHGGEGGREYRWDTNFSFGVGRDDVVVLVVAGAHGVVDRMPGLEDDGRGGGPLEFFRYP